MAALYLAKASRYFLALYSWLPSSLRFSADLQKQIEKIVLQLKRGNLVLNFSRISFSFIEKHVVFGYSNINDNVLLGQNKQDSYKTFPK